MILLCVQVAEEVKLVLNHVIDTNGSLGHLPTKAFAMDLNRRHRYAAQAPLHFTLCYAFTFFG